VECAPSAGVDDPVEYNSEEEEGNTVENFVVNILVQLKRCEANVCGDEKEEQENACWSPVSERSHRDG
jgi:hypothetical protein